MLPSIAFTITRNAFITTVITHASITQSFTSFLAITMIDPIAIKQCVETKVRLVKCGHIKSDGSGKIKAITAPTSHIQAKNLVTFGLLKKYPAADRQIQGN